MKRACMVVHSYYPSDPRVRREAEALVEHGWQVDVLCLRGENELSDEQCDGVSVHRLPVRRHRGSGIAIYMLEYLAFSTLAAICLAWLHLYHRYAIVHAHNMPDFLVFVALIPRLLGARVVLDIHDLVPELYAAKFGGSTSHLTVRATRLIERLSCGFAHHVITAGEPFRRRLIERSVPAGKITVIMNSADPRLFTPRSVVPQSPDNQVFTVMYHGGLFERYGLDIAIHAVARLHGQLPGLRLVIYGTGEAQVELERLVVEQGLADCVTIGGFVPLDHIPRMVQNADLGVVPYRRNPFTDMLYPTKAFEYIAMGKPVVMSRTQAVVDLFGEIPDMFVEPEDVEALAERIAALYHDPERCSRLTLAGRRAYAPYTWDAQRAQLVTLIEQVTERRPPVANLNRL